MRRLREWLEKISLFLVATGVVGWVYVKQIGGGVMPDSWITLCLALAVWLLIVTGFVLEKGTPVTIGLLVIAVPFFMPLVRDVLYWVFWPFFFAWDLLARFFGINFGRIDWGLIFKPAPVPVAQVPFLGWIKWLAAVSVVTIPLIIGWWFWEKEAKEKKAKVRRRKIRGRPGIG